MLATMALTATFMTTMPPSIKKTHDKPLNEDDVEQAIREILRVATLWATNKQAGVSPSAMDYHEDFLRAVCQAALHHWNKLPLKRPSGSKVVLRGSDFASYSVLLHVMHALDEYQRLAKMSKRGPSQSERTALAQLIQAALPALGSDEVHGLRDIEAVLKRFEKEADNVRRLEGNLSFTLSCVIGGSPAGAVTAT